MPRYIVTAEQTIKQIVTVEVEADDEAAVHKMVEEDLTWDDFVDAQDEEVQSNHILNIEKVEDEATEGDEKS